MPGEGHGGATAYVSYGDTSSSLPNQISEWHNCVWDHPSDPQDNDNYYAFYTHGSNVTSVLVDNMSSLGGNFAAGNGDNPAAVISVKGGLVQNARLEVYGQSLLFAAMNTQDGSVIDVCMPTHNRCDWIRFLKLIDRRTPPDKQLHLIMDNYAAHKAPEVQ